jgi:hypothetical protein
MTVKIAALVGEICDDATIVLDRHNLIYPYGPLDAVTVRRRPTPRFARRTRYQAQCLHFASRR